MAPWTTRRAGAALAVASCLTLAAACGGDRTGADTTMAMDTTSMAVGGAGAGDAAGMGDPQIIAQVSAGNAAEISAGTIAGEKGTAADVKSFGATMVEDHQRLQAQLDSVATRLAITPVAPAEADTLAAAFEDRREALRGGTAGSDWDRDFMNLQVQMHESTLDMLNRATSAARNGELRGALQQAVPVVQGHLDQARQILTALGGPRADSAGG